jgi:hypothetical protein
MPNKSQRTEIYHITDVSNLARIIETGGLKSDALIAQGQGATVIGYAHIKRRRLTQIRVACCGNRFVGEFVPFYFCPRSPMLYAINQGRTGLPPGCQRSIVHLVSSVSIGIGVGSQWAISSGNAGAAFATFDNQLDALDALDWSAIDAHYWSGRTDEKAAEFLIADFFPWDCIKYIGCHNQDVLKQLTNLIANLKHKPTVSVRNEWYY